MDNFDIRHRRVIASIVLIVLGTPAVFGQSSDTFVPARRLSGSLPSTLSPNVVGWIEEMLEVAVNPTGGVAQTKALRASPLPTDLVAPAVATWRFRPATDRGAVVASRVLVEAIIRPPQLDNSPTLGNPAVDLAAPSPEIPFPVARESPSYPPLAVGDGVVLVEALVGIDGRIRQSQVVTEASGFDRAALDAAVRWSFRPARRNGRGVEAYAYLLFGFRQPTSAGPRKPPSR